MIDSAELDRIEQAAKAANGAVGAVLARRGDGLYAGLPYDDPETLLEAAAESAKHVPRLIAEVRRLAPASYVHGPEACVEGDCDDEDPPAGQWCSHVTEKVATFDDVKRAEYLARLVGSIRERLVDDDNTDELVVSIDDALGAMEAAESAGWAH